MNHYYTQLFHNKYSKNSQLIYSQIPNSYPHYVIRKYIKQITLHGVYNRQLKKRIFHKINIDFSSYNQHKYKLEYISEIIKKFKSSGFFQKIILSHFSLNNKIFFDLKLHPYPLIKVIKIKYANNLKIPRKELVNLLNNQIGYPRNLKIMNSISKKIQEWYFIRGYRWSNVTYNIDDHVTNNLVISIQEGIIDNVELICENKNNVNKYNNIKHLILNELNVKIGRLLNYNNIELGLIRLKNFKSIAYCNYHVNKIDNHKFKVTIYYRLQEKKSSYIFNQNINKSFYSSQLKKIQYLHFIDQIKSRYFSTYLNKYIDIKNSYKYGIFINHLQDTFFSLLQLFTKEYFSQFYSDSIIQNISRIQFSFYKYLINPFTIFLNKKINKQIVLIHNWPQITNNTNQVVQIGIKLNINNLFLYSNSLINLDRPQNNLKNILNSINRQIINISLVNQLLKTININQSLQLIEDVYLGYKIHRSFISLNLILYNNVYFKSKSYIYCRKFINYFFNIRNIINIKKYNFMSRVQWISNLQVAYKPVYHSTILLYEKYIYLLLNWQIIISPAQILSQIVNPFLHKLKIHTDIYIFSSPAYTSSNFLKFYHPIQDSKYARVENLNQILKSKMTIYFWKLPKTILFVEVDFLSYLTNFTNLKKSSYNATFSTGLLFNLNIKFMPKVKIQYKFHDHLICKLYTNLLFN